MTKDNNTGYISASIIMSKVLQELGMTVADFSETCGVKYGRISDIVRGRTKKFTPVLVNEICSALPQINKNFLYTGEGDVLNKGYVAKTTLPGSSVPIINKQVNDLMKLQQELLNKQEMIIQKLEDLHQREIAVAQREYNVQLREYEYKLMKLQTTEKEASKV